MESKFNCDGCGLCCLRAPKILTSLDRGDGLCKYFDTNTHECTIYESRPLICNVDKFYDKWMKDRMTREQWHKLNYCACNKMKEEAYNGE